MNTLFPLEQKYPEGFLYFPEFIDEKEEVSLLKSLSELDLRPFVFQGFEAKRKVASYGYDYNFGNRSISKGEPIPAIFNDLIEKVTKKLSLPSENMVEILVTEYPAGSVINWHRDAPPFEKIAGISLLSECRFRFRPYDKSKQSRSSLLSFPVKRRSLYLIQQAARTDWEHSIAPVKEKRYSITLRTLRQEVQ